MPDVFLTLLWAYAEAIFWPFMPDAVLVPLAALHPTEAWKLVPAAMVGSATGSLVWYAVVSCRFWPEDAVNQLIDAQIPFASLLGRVLMIRKPMIEQARRWLEAEGPSGVKHQPLSFIPFKVFAVLAPLLKLPLLPFLGWAMLVRGVRFALVCSISATVGLLFGRWLYPVWHYAVLVWAVFFCAMLMRAVRHWERKGEP